MKTKVDEKKVEVKKEDGLLSPKMLEILSLYYDGRENWTMMNEKLKAILP